MGIGALMRALVALAAIVALLVCVCVVDFAVPAPIEWTPHCSLVTGMDIVGDEVTVVNILEKNTVFIVER